MEEQSMELPWGKGRLQFPPQKVKSFNIINVFSQKVLNEHQKIKVLSLTKNIDIKILKAVFKIQVLFYIQATLLLHLSASLLLPSVGIFASQYSDIHPKSFLCVCAALFVLSTLLLSIM
jgi:hypothetical protein